MSGLLEYVRKLGVATKHRWKGHGPGVAARYATTKLGWDLRQYIPVTDDPFGGLSIYGTEWDLLIVLDACRADLFRDVLANGEYEFVKSAQEATAPAGQSIDWLREVFTIENATEVAQTAYVTANPHTEFAFEEDNTVGQTDFGYLDEIWRYGWDEDAGTVLAETVTDRAIDVVRSTDAERTIVHYMQPHFPVVHTQGFSTGSGTTWSGSVWQRAICGEVTEADIWTAYRANLHYVLESLETLLENVDAEQAIITADHGNAIGEKGFYGHGDFPVAAVRTVPWCVVSTRDTGCYEPTMEREYDPTRDRWETKAV